MRLLAASFGPSTARSSSLPERLEPSAKRLRLFGNEPAPDPLSRLRVLLLPRQNERRQPRPPRRQRAVRHRKAAQNREILEGSEPVAQPLRFGHPELAELRPERLDQLHLVAM